MVRTIFFILRIRRVVEGKGDEGKLVGEEGVN